MSEGDLALMDNGAPAAEPTPAPEPQVADTPVVEEHSTEPALPEITPPEGQEPEANEPPPQATKPDTVARDVSRMIRELRDAHPDKAQLLKQVQDSFFRSQTYQQHYETPEAAQRAKVTLEALGGDDGIATLQQHSTLYQQMEDMASKGAPEMISSWREEYPDGFRKAAPLVLSELEKLDGRAFNETLRPHLVEALEGSGLSQSLQRIAYLAQQSNNDMLTREVNAVQAWLGGLTQEEQQRQQLQNDPRQAEIDRRSQELNQRETSIRNQQITSEVQPYLKDTIDKSLGEYTKGRTISEQAKEDLRNAVLSGINETLRNDKVYQANMAALNGKGDVKAIVRYIRSNVDAIKGRIAREVWSKRSEPFRQPAAAPANGQPAKANGQPAPRAATANSAILRVPQKPSGNDIDWSRDPDRMLFISGKAYLKSGANAGKLVSWR